MLPVEGLREPAVKNVGTLGYELQSAILSEQLLVGRSVVIECVASPQVRDGWGMIARQHGAAFWPLETTCSDRGVHRSRFDERHDGSVGNWQLRWENVEQTMRWYEPHPSAVFVADSINGIEQNVTAVLGIIRRS